jgi:hypothetical protein
MANRKVQADTAGKHRLKFMKVKNRDGDKSK